MTNHINLKIAIIVYISHLLQSHLIVIIHVWGKKHNELLLQCGIKLKQFKHFK